MYYSTARTEQSDEQLLEILEESRVKNAVCGITGLLLYGDGVFFQVLEGAEPDVRARYARIEKDRRHQGLLVAVEREVEERSFGSWSMGYTPLDPELLKGVDALIPLERTGNPINQVDCDRLIGLLVESFMINQRLA